MARPILVTVCLILAVIALDQADRVIADTNIICENQNEVISCPSGTVINVRTVNYGRTTTAPDVCPHAKMSNTNCRSGPAARDAAIRTCEGKQQCSLRPTNSNMGGDPCVGTYKYLEIQYGCVSSPPSDNTNIICENQNEVISCPSGTVINVQTVNYGRTTSAPDVCPHAKMSNTNCRSGPGARDAVIRTCEGKQQCSLQPTNSNMGGDPCVGTYKYLEIQYGCVSSPPSDNTNIICENQNEVISCPSGTVINVQSVNYGRTTTASDVCPHAKMSNTNCRSGPGARDAVIRTCEGKQQCSLQPTNSNMGGDPCVGTYKYLEIQYGCVSSPPSDIGCNYNCQTYTAGESFPSIDGCNTCSCSADGSVPCTKIGCPPTCRYNCQTYTVGQSFPSDDRCNTCTCRQRGGVVCTKKACLPDRKIICERKNGVISCPSGTVIHVQSVNYGRTTTAPDVCPHAQMSNTNCRSGPAARKAVVRSCEGKQQCSLRPTNSNMGGDPCRGTYKYLEIMYRCS